MKAIVGDARILAGVDSVGGPASGEVLSLLSENGTLVVFGAMQSPVMEIRSGDVIFKQAAAANFTPGRAGKILSGTRSSGPQLARTTCNSGK